MAISSKSLPWMRLIVGLLQGLALLLMYEAVEHKQWPATDGLVFAPLLFAATFVPMLVISSLDHLRLRTLVIWAVIATLLCIGLGVYDIFRDPVVVIGQGTAPRIVPSWVAWWSLAAALFILHALIVSGQADGRLIARYPAHFEVSWKHGVQFVLAVLFVGLLWGLLFLGAELFRLIKIEFLAELIRRKTFAIPVTAVAFSYAIHITDARASIVQGARTLALILFSWLLPLMVLLSGAFILALLFTGLDPLWSTRRATGILLSAAAALVFLVNAAYQDGRPELPTVAILSYARSLAAFVLLPLVVLAAYGLVLRIAQYGWTPERITALACIVVAVCYSGGYLVAALRAPVAMTWLEPTNIATSLVIVGILIVLRTPIADPAWISVTDQMRRLEAGKVAPDQFDFAFLRFRAGRYGEAALRQLAAQTEGPQASLIAERANLALQAKNQFEVGRLTPRPTTTPAQRASRITVISPGGAALPAGFADRDWNSFPQQWKLPICLVRDVRCEAIVADLDGDGQPEILLLSLPTGAAAAFKRQSADAAWDYLGGIANVNCAGVRDALHEGRFEIVQPAMKEISANGQRLRVTADCAPAMGAK